MKKLLLILLCLPMIGFGQQTYVPDDNFEQALINFGYDIILDDSVLTTSIDTVTSLNVQQMNISDLTGIQDFSALTYLYCHYNQLTSLDVSNNTALAFLVCVQNALTSLDLSNNTALTTLYCQGNPGLYCIDIGNNSSLTTLNMDTWTSISVNCNPIYGCTDSLACNYDPLANTNQINCILPDGCTDATACNYDATATCDDGSCIGISGCTDATSYNYNSSATCDDGSCAFIPQGINYQAVARDATGDVLMNQALDVKLSIISDITTGNVSWQETHQVTTNEYGLFTAIIGGGATTGSGSSATFDVVDWGASNHLLKVEIDYDGSGYIDMGTTALMSVPYALYSANSGAVGAQGPAGANGVDGTNGVDGINGTDGAVGATGSAGNDGAVGAQGPQGLPGLAGTDGTNGTNGVDGVGIAQTLSISGDTLFISSGNYIILPSSTPNLQIGDFHQGGFICYLDGLGGGLIAAPSDQSTGAAWGCYGTAILGADGTAIGTGMQNTIDIVNECTTSGIAADICANLTLNGYGDWFLPSKDELNAMYLNIGQGSALGNIGGFANSSYWSSTELSLTGAWNLYFLTSHQSGVNKSYPQYVRAVRAF